VGTLDDGDWETAWAGAVGVLVHVYALQFVHRVGCGDKERKEHGLGRCAARPARKSTAVFALCFPHPRTGLQVRVRSLQGKEELGHVDEVRRAWVGRALGAGAAGAARLLRGCH
jgi:hypothetical protein